MDKLKARFNEDPVFAVSVSVIAVLVLTKLVKETAKGVTSAALAYRASQIF